MRTKKNIRAWLTIAWLALAPGALRAAVGSNTSDTLKTATTDKAILSKFEKLLKRMDPSVNSTLTGVLHIVDKQDARGSINAPFVMSKNGSAFYYRIGNTETFNADGIYLYIDNKEKVAAIAGQKEGVIAGGLGAIAGFAKNAALERYKLSSSVSGNVQTITMLNEDHLACKQYSLSFDKASMKIRRVFVRLTDQQDPSNKQKEKVITLDVTKWEAAGDPHTYFKKSAALSNIRGEWKMAGRYKNYKLIKL